MCPSRSPMHGSMSRSSWVPALPASSIWPGTARSVECARVSTTPCRCRPPRPAWRSVGPPHAATADDRMPFRILTLNQISPRGLTRFPADRYEVGAGFADPDAILVRPAELNGTRIAPRVRAIGRAGVGVNNIPVAEMSRRGIPVFNTPGANANAVKELVLAGLFLAARNIAPAWLFARGLSGDDAAIEEAVEAGKKRFVVFELPGRTLGVVGLGAVGVEVANSALALGMKVLGYDPQLTVQRAWQLSSSAEQARSLEDLFTRSDAITVHVPLNDHTRGLVNAARLALAKPDATLLN